MSILRLLLLLPLSVILVSDVSSASSAAPSLLPRIFAGWHLTKSSPTSAEPRAADAANAAVLKEYGFIDITTATYTREDGRQLSLKAARFEDASGAFGAYTFYRTAEMHSEEIGDQGSSLNQRVLFFRGKVLVDAVFQKLSGMSAAELRELADSLPKIPGTEAKLPDLPGYLPKESYVANTAKYIVGPSALEKIDAPLTAEFVDFSKGAEVVLGDYSVSNNAGKLMLIGYPTAQIAAGELARIETAEQTHQLQEVPLAKRRTGRIIVMASRGLGADAAKSLVAAVNYDTDVTWNQNTYHNPRDNVGRVVLGAILLAAVIMGLLLASSAAFVGFRLTVKRLLPGKVFDRPEQVELIALNLSDPPPQSPESGVSSSIKAG
jgi:hypothetical protein